MASAGIESSDHCAEDRQDVSSAYAAEVAVLDMLRIYPRNVSPGSRAGIYVIVLIAILVGGAGRVNDRACAPSGLGKTPKNSVQGWIGTTLWIGGRWTAPKAGRGTGS